MWSESLPCTWWLYYVACSSIVWSCYRSYSLSSPETILIGSWKVLGTPWWQRLESHPGLWHVYASICMKTYAEYNYSPRNDPQTWNHRPQFHPDMIPTPSSRRPRNDPQLIIGMKWFSVTELLQLCYSVYVLELHLTFTTFWRFGYLIAFLSTFASSTSF